MHGWLKLRRVLLQGVVLLVMLIGLGPGTPVAADQTDLLRLEIHSATERQALVQSGVQIYARLFTGTGQEVLLLPAREFERFASRRASALSGTVNILDSADQAGDYFLVRLSDDQVLPTLEAHVRVLDVLGPQAVVKASLAEMEALHEAGVHFQTLELHALQEYTTAIQAPELDGPDPFIQAMVYQVNQTQVLNHVRRLSGEDPVTIGSSSYFLTTRFTPNETAITRATRYVHDHLEALGLYASYHYYYLVYNGWAGERRNVVAEQPGVLHPEQVLYVTAHMDSRRETDSLSFSFAPGADDNASGTAAVLAAAEVLSQHTFAYTIRYVLFTGEEQIMKGSAPYTADLAARDEQVLGVLNLDMIAYDSGGVNQFELHTRPGEAGDEALARTFRDVVRHYELNLEPVILPDALSFSDHSSFWQYDYPAVLAMEDWGNPNWHKTTDTVSTLDPGYFTQAVRAAVGTLAHLAEFYAPNLSGVVTHSSLAAPVADARVSFSSAAGSYSALTAADGSFIFMIPGGIYDLSVQADGFATFAQDGVAAPDPLTGQRLEISSDLCQLLDRVQVRGEGLPAQPGQAVTFRASPHSGSPPVSYHWDIAGSQSNLPEITFTFEQAGSYPLQLEISNPCGVLQAQHLMLVGGQALYLPVTVR